ncbi:MAG: DUF169 domain-containing protein [Halanaerobium sp.]
MKNLADILQKLENILGLKRRAAEVKFIDDNFKEIELGKYDSETKTRYFQALMRSGKGEKIMITENNISCPASAAAFGLKKLPENLKKVKKLSQC